MQNRRAFLSGGLIATAALAAAPVLAQDDPDEDVLPRGKYREWSAERLRRADPPGIDGAIAQIRGDGRFGILCERGDDKGTFFYRTPRDARGELRDLGDEVRMTFRFDKGPREVRRLAWDENGRYWRDDFGPGSQLARYMRRNNRVRVTVKGAPAIDETFTLVNSWNSIDAMFSMCRM